MNEFCEMLGWKAKNFVRDWVFPAYHWKHLLIDRYDRVKLPGISKCDYCDCVERMFLANMALIKDFIEKEKPEKIVCWYEDDEIGGPRWHKDEHPLISNSAEYDGMFIMDIIKDVYHWYTKVYPELLKQCDEALSEWSADIVELPLFAVPALRRHEQLEKQIFNESQKYLHLCIELRPYLWT